MTRRSRKAKSGSSDVDANARDVRHATVHSWRTRGSDPSIGMFHPIAGSRSASGTAVFVQETMRELTKLQSAYMYTQQGPLSNGLRRSDIDVIEIQPNRDWERFRRIAGHLPINLRRISPQLSTSTSVFVNSVLDGTIKHIERNVDVLFTHHMGEAILLSNSVDIPVVHVVHGCQHVGIGGKSIPYLANLAGTVANSHQTAKGLSEKFGWDVDGIVYPGVRIEEFNPERTPAFERDEFVVMFVGRFYPDKGVYDLIKAFARLPASAHLYLVGRGDTDRVQDLITKLEISEQVTIEGEVTHDRLPHYYTAADVVCLPSYYESFGMVNVEAMACGTPIVTTDIPGIREYAIHDETCLLVPPGDTGALAEQLTRLVNSGTLQKRLSEAGMGVAERYSWRSTAAEFVRISERVLENQ